ncbi:hypothetical protein [Pseudonocardia sp. GCM10023141]|uniref:SbtR family transcriptional regulator n=1 Tax=Pseudonocardia sp. GCM10023141 TaxID=3252653 RepID=UPI00360FE085
MLDPDPWHGFVMFIEGIFELQSQDRGLREAISRNAPENTDVAAACGAGFQHVGHIIERARTGGLRADFGPADLATLIWAMTRVIEESPREWRRFLGFYLDGLRVV